MLKMLVVDDDNFERDGVKYLLDKYEFQLEIAEADSGESAFAYMETNSVDILFTDIRMKEMDGLQLAEKVRELGRPVKVIFMSAYGEFEYAQRAIDLNAIRYILKPVQVSEFVKVLSQVIQLCEEEKHQKSQQERMQQAYLKEVRYEKQKLFTDLILGTTEVADKDRDLPMPIVGFDGCSHMRMLMLDSRKRIFDRIDPGFEGQFAEVVGRRFDFFHLNEFQGLLLVEALPNETMEAFATLGQRLIGRFAEMFGQNMTVVVSGLVDDAKQLYHEYHEMEAMLENKFFFEEATVLLTGQTPFVAGDMTMSVGDGLGELTQLIERKAYDKALLKFDQLFDQLQNSKQFSVVYVKYVCMEIVKAIFDATPRKDTDRFRTNLEQIFRTSRLNELRQVMYAIVPNNAHTGGPGGDGISKAIEEVVRLIEKEYHTDLSLELLAERVYLSPSYLSYLFKKQKQISFNKYITLYRMEKAKELLATTNRKIVDIGHDVGYTNFPYFSSLFKNHYGKTPSQFREES